MAKITKATFKKFMRENAGRVYIKNTSRFDGMVDCVTRNENAGFSLLKRTAREHENNMGFDGIWLVGSSRDYFSEYNENGMRGISVYNCCGSFTLAIREE